MSNLRNFKLIFNNIFMINKYLIRIKDDFEIN